MNSSNAAMEAQRPVAYVISTVEGFVDMAKVRHYAELAGPAMAKYGGRFIVSNAEAVVAEGEWHGRVSIVEFPSMERAKAWYDSSENEAARAITPAAFRGRVLMWVEGASSKHEGR